MRKFVLTALMATISLPALAEDSAVLIGNDRYRSLDRLVGGADVVEDLRQARRAGYDADALRNGSIAAMRGLLTELEQKSSDADRLIVALSGRFVTDGKRTWLLSATSPKPSLFGVEREAISVESVMQVLEATPGQAVLLLGYDKDSDERFTQDLREGIGSLDIPQGVTVLRGTPVAIGDMLGEQVLAEGKNIIWGASRDNDVNILGFRPRSLVMQQSEDAVPREPVVIDRALELNRWNQAKQTDTVASYQAYLKQYPNGTYSEQARTAIEAIKSEPNRADRVLEDRLGLTRAQRQDIQRDLSLLGYNTRGIDGIFGRGTRTAISNWQQQNGFRQTGYLLDEQVVRIDAQAARRAAQLEAEAAREQAALDRRDRAFWEETGVSGREADLRRYLARYPDGLYSDAAENLLEQFEAEKMEAAVRADRDAWTTARERNTVRSYRTYLNQQPNGAFRQAAQSRLETLERQDTSQLQQIQAAAAEEALRLNRVTRQLAEQKLAQLGLEPGPVDGTFDRRTRRAIRRFQQARGLKVTGYLNQQAVVMMLVAQ